MPQCVDASPFLQRPNVVGQVAGCISNLAPLMHCLAACHQRRVASSCVFSARFYTGCMPPNWVSCWEQFWAANIYSPFMQILLMFSAYAQGKTKQLGNNKQTVKAEGRRGRWLGLLWHLPPRLGRESLVGPSPRQASPAML